MVSIVTNLLASEYAASVSKVDRKSRLFRRLTVLQCQIAQFHNLWRLPLIVRLFKWDWSNEFLEEVNWYFVSKKILTTYCEKKKCFNDREKLSKLIALTLIRISTTYLNSIFPILQFEESSLINWEKIEFKTNWIFFSVRT